MFDEYKAGVLQAYKHKKAANALSPNLTRSTPAKLRAECLEVFNSRFLKKDELALKSFFGSRDDATGYVQAIRKCDVDKFRPLDNFLKGNTTDSEDKNIELLAWLIDFEPRPYRFGQTYLPATANTKPVITQVRQDVTPVPKSNKNIFLLLIVPVIIGIGVYAVFYHPAKPGHSANSVVSGPEKCMYWAGDHYQAVSCNQKLGDTLEIALDPEKIVHFKRITTPDTLTANSLGKVWYIKINNHLEYYTAAGFHPTHPDRRLLPLSKYMLNKYVHH